MDHSNTGRTLAWGERPLRELVRLAWPIAISHVSFSLMTAVDTMFVGRLGASALAGVAVGGMTMFTLLCLGMGLLRSIKITVAHAVGAGRPQAADAYLTAGLWLALGLGVAFALGGQLVAAMLPVLIGGGEEGAIAREYAAIRLLGSPIVLVGVALRETRHGLGDARSPMIAALTANLVNVPLVALFSMVFDWGVPGVAWATTLAQLVEASLLAQQQYARGFGQHAWTSADLRVLLRMGVPLGIERFFDVASFTLMIGIFTRMGVIDLAAHQVANQALMLAFLPGMALGEATCVLIGQAVGAASFRTVPHVQRAALIAGYGYVFACSSVFVAFGSLLATLFTRDAAVISRASELFLVAAAFLWVLPLYQIGQSSLRGIGDVRFAAMITVIAAWAGAPLFAAILGLGFGMGAIGGWIGIGCEIAVAAWLFWRRMQGGAWLETARRCSFELQGAARVTAVAPAALGFARPSDPGPSPL